MRRETPIAVTVLLLALAGCAPRHLDSRDLSSTLRATSSLAAETAIFIDYLRTGHATAIYARAHTHYLAEELHDERESLDHALVDPRLDPRLQEALASCREQQELLKREMEQLERALGTPREFPAIAQRIRAIGAAATQTRQTL